MRIFIPTFLIFLISLQVSAQEFTHQADINNVTQEGYYRLQLPPEITHTMQKGFPDIRVYDDKNKEIPYILHSEVPLQKRTMYREYSIIRKEYVGAFGHTRLVIHNPKKNVITNISLSIRNADVSKWLKLSGSDNNSDYFTIKNKYYFHSFYTNDDTQEIRVINFPPSNYEYYELLVYDFFDNPIDILGAGYYDNSLEKGKYSEIPDAAFVQKDSIESKQTFLYIDFNNSQYIDRLDFEIEGPEFYLRDAKLLIERTRKYKKKTEIYYQTVKQFKLSSNSTNSIRTADLTNDKLVLIIENNDDSPLIIKNVKAWQLNHYIELKLDPGNKYKIKFGNNNCNAPVYDLRFFKDSIPKNLPLVQLSNITRSDNNDMNKGFLIDPGRIWLWLIIGVVVLLLLLMSVKMMREMKNR